MANILTCYYRPKPGGLCKRLFRAIEALLEQGHTVHYLAVIPFPITHHNCYFHQFPWPEDKTENLLFWGVFQILAPAILIYLGYKHRITHIFSFGYTYSFLTQPLRFIKGIPSSLFIRADTIENHRLKGRDRWLLILEQWLEGFGIAGVRVYGVSDSSTHSITSRHKLLKPKYAGTLRNDTKHLPPVHNPQYNSSGPLRFACVGILEKRKNQRFLLDVFEKINPEHAQLYLFGVGPEEANLKRMVRIKGIRANVHFMGWVETEKIWQNVDVLLMPSIHEGASNAILEAMERGIPVLATDVPEHREILPQYNLIPLDDPSAWQDRLEAILLRPNLDLKEILDRQFSCTQRLHFDWDRKICKIILDADSGA